MLRSLCVSASALVCLQASAQLYGVTGAGTLLRLDPATGAGTVVGTSGFECNGATADNQGRILVGGGAGAAADQIIAIDPETGAGSVFLNIVGRQTGFGVRGMAMSPAGTLYIVLSPASTSAIDQLGAIDLTTGQCTIIGPTTRSDIQGLACSPSGELYAVGLIAGGNLYRLSTATGAATVIGGGTFGGDDQALEFLPDGTAVSCRGNLRSVNLGTGATTLVGATGQTDIRGMAYIAAPVSCYADCDGVGALTGNDFACFLASYVNGQSYADCDGVGGLTANDFVCFLGAYAAGCS